jgi:SAM-dependent methyltransferase
MNTFAKLPTIRQHEVAFQTNLYADANPTRRWLHETRCNWVAGAIERYTRAHDTVMEVGVGCGIFTRLLAARCASVLAVDINPDFLVALGPFERIARLQADATEALPVGGMRVVLSSEVLEHVPRDQSLAMLRNLAGAIRDDGFLILTTPQRYASMELAARLLRFGPVLALARRLYGPVAPLGHTNLLTRRELRQQLSAAGFEVVEMARRGLYIPGLAEIGGRVGQRLAAALVPLLDRIPVLGGLLWTQCYVARRVP